MPDRLDRGVLPIPFPMTFDFDPPIVRVGTDSQKWQKYAGRDVLPLWVADMDFKSSPAIIEALHQRVEVHFVPPRRRERA